MRTSHRCWAEVDLEALRENLAWIRHRAGPRIKVISDGVTIVDVDQTKLTAPDEKGYADPKTKSLKGYIGLQDSHAPAGSYIEFRNVRIKELKPASDSK